MGTSRHRLQLGRSTCVALVAVVAVLAAGCGSSDGGDDGGGAGSPTVVVTTNILGDVVRQSIGKLVDVEVIMPLGSDPHDFAPSARQAEAMEEADLLVVNGAGFEDGMRDIIRNAVDGGTPIFTATNHVALLTLGGASEADGADDPHFWTDPDRMRIVVDALSAAVAEIPGVDQEALSESTGAYLAELDELATSMDDTLRTVPNGRRVLVTNHEVFGYFADRFDFEVIGAVVPSLSTGAEPSAAALERLADLIEADGVPAVFAETTTSSRLAEVLASEVDGDLAGEVIVVELFSESLGDSGSGAETYVDMMNMNAALVAGALGGE